MKSLTKGNQHFLGQLTSQKALHFEKPTGTEKGTEKHFKDKQKKLDGSCDL